MQRCNDDRETWLTDNMQRSANSIIDTDRVAAGRKTSAVISIAVINSAIVNEIEVIIELPCAEQLHNETFRRATF